MVCSLEAQGLFSIIKCLYWQKECVLSIRQIKRRYDRDDLISELVEEGCIKILSDEMVSISFLNEQFETFHDKRKKLSEAGKKGVLSKKNKATLKPPLSQGEAKLKPPLSIKNREEESREEEIRIEKSKVKDIESRKLDFSIKVKEFSDYDEKLLNNFVDYWTEHGETDKKMRFEKEKSFGITQRLSTWKRNQEKWNNNNTSNSQKIDRFQTSISATKKKFKDGW